MLWQSTKFKKLDDSIHKEHYDRMHQNSPNAKYAKKMVKYEQNGRTRHWNVGQLYEYEARQYTRNQKRKQTRINGKFNLQLEKYLRFITKNRVF